MGLHQNTVTLLCREFAVRVKLEAMDRLCRVFECDVRDLFEFVPEEGESSGDSGS